MADEEKQYPHELFSLCDKISKNMAGTKIFRTKDNLSIMVHCYVPDEPKIILSISKPRKFGTNKIEETLHLFYNTGKCEYTVSVNHTSLVAESVTYLENRDKHIEESPYRDWFRCILDGAYEALKASTRIAPYTGEVLPFFEETKHDDELRKKIHFIEEQRAGLKQKIEESEGKPGIYKI